MPDDQNDQPNMDLIQMVQRARMQHDSQARPSEMSAVYWLEFKHESAPPPTSRAGQWVIDIPAQQADSVWQAVKDATARGELGYKSKLATISRTGTPEMRTLAIRTIDADDSADVARVRAGLDALGLGAGWDYERG